MIRILIYQEVSAAHSERHHISELNIDFIKKFEIGHGPPAADQRFLEKKHEFGMSSAHRRLARRKGHCPIGYRWRKSRGKASKM